MKKISPSTMQELFLSRLFNLDYLLKNNLSKNIENVPVFIKSIECNNAQNHQLEKTQSDRYISSISISELTSFKKSYPDFPIKEMKKRKEKNSKYLLPAFFAYHDVVTRFSQLDNKSQLLNSWSNKLSQLQSIASYSYFESVNKNNSLTKELYQIEMKMLYAIFENNLCLDLSNENFWSSISESKKLSKSEINHYAKKLISCFENESDAVNFAQSLKNNYINTNRDNLQLSIYLLLLKKYSAKESVEYLPNFLTSRLSYYNNEKCELEVLKMLKYFQNDLTKKTYVNYFENSYRKKTIQLCKEALIAQNYFQNQKRKSFFLEDKEEIIYVKKMVVDKLFLREKINDNKLLTETLINISLCYLKKKYKFSWNNHTNSFELTLHAHNENDLCNFTQDVSETFNFAFNDYLDQTTYDKLSRTRNGKRIYHEEDEQINNSFSDRIKIYFFKKSLDKQLNDKTSSSYVIREKI